MASLKLLDVHGRVKVCQLYCKVLPMVAGQGRLTATTNGHQEVACWTQKEQAPERESDSLDVYIYRYMDEASGITIRIMNTHTY